jgi:hypothetical protein
MLNSKWGLIDKLGFASFAVALASWSGVTRVNPWPIAVIAVSPAYQLSLNFFFFQALLAIKPLFSP